MSERMRTEEFNLVVYGKPEPAGSKRAFHRPGMKFPVVVDDNPKGKPWKQEIAQAAIAMMHGASMFNEPVQARIKFFVKRPKGHTGKRGLLPSAPAYPSVKPDVLKLTRAVEDAMSGIVYVDDALIVRELIEKHYGEPERVEICIKVMPPPFVTSVEVNTPSRARAQKGS